jgi:hypothetical protein
MKSTIIEVIRHNSINFLNQPAGRKRNSAVAARMLIKTDLGASGS